MIAIVDYGVGNLFSLTSSLKYIGADCVVNGNPDELVEFDKIILPGVGAFGDAADKLRVKGLDKAVIKAAKQGKPVLGICLGMQLLFETSEEYGIHEGLGLIPGEVKSLAAALDGDDGFKVPHIGWNNLVMLKSCELLKNTPESSCVYYVHSFFAPVARNTVAGSQYGSVQISAAVQHENVFGTQFHPEKSGETGLNILKAFAGL